MKSLDKKKPIFDIIDDIREEKKKLLDKKKTGWRKMTANDLKKGIDLSKTIRGFRVVETRSDKTKELDCSKNEKAEKIVGLRKIPKNSVIFDQPCELDYHCPVCKYKNVVNGNYDERLEWSEYNGFIWCRVCNKDYPSCLCMPNIEKATDIYLDCLTQQRTELLEEILNLECLKKERLLSFSSNPFIKNQIRKEIKEEIKKL